MRFLRTLYALIRGRFRSGGFKPGGHIPGGPLPARLHDGEWLIWIDDDGHWVGRQYRKSTAGEVEE